MKLTEKEARFLTALLREQHQTGCRGSAHDLLRKQAYPDAPLTGPGSLAFAYEAVPLTGLLLREFTDLEAIDQFCRTGELIPNVEWPWSSTAQYQERLAEAQQEWISRKEYGSPLAAGS